MRSIKRRNGNSLRTNNRKVQDVIKFCQSTRLEKVVEVIGNAQEDNCNASYLQQTENGRDDENGLHMDEIREKDGENGLSMDGIDENSEPLLSIEERDQITEQTNNWKCEGFHWNAENTLIEDIRIWSLVTQVPNSSVDFLLKILRKHGHHELPSCARTLKQTPRSISIRSMDPGNFWYFGVVSILEILKKENVLFPQTLTLNINIDGVPLFESSKSVFWPILGMFTEFPRLKPFVIGLYFDENGGKPKDINDYLQEFVDEMTDLLIEGFNGTIFKLGNCPLDAPALAFVKDTKAYNSKKACHKCDITGSFVSGRMCFPQVENLTLRTDETFRSRNDPLHHQSTSPSPLEKLPMNMVDNFNLDYLHVALLGVIKKKLKILMDKFKMPTHSTLRNKLKLTNIEAINRITMMARETQPVEIQRAIRTLDYLPKMKGKEFRTFILYYGIVALRNNVHKDLFENYLLLHIALTICLSDQHKHLLDVAELCFKKFVKDFKALYGHCLASYNVHSTLHLVNEVRRWGPLDNYSTFPYENMLGFLKQLPNSGHRPLEQTVNRYLESLQLNIKNFREEMSLESKLDNTLYSFIHFIIF